ncbi:glycosyltransferase [Arthrobacter sp. SAFR-044]|uniref:glycosyltransferase n=1 Tax=Arthrobacter sp. SAFR-044 TaxID=3387278 RepID=UPI003F7BEE43
MDVVIAAYLEASVIASTVQRLQRQLAGAGVAGKVIVVASDDDTYQAAAAADRTLKVPRNGKPAALNAGVSASEADIVVLTDANCAIEPDGWPLFVQTGLRSARLLTGSKRERGARERLFWRYEGLLKSRHGEQELSATLAVVGEFLAFRRTDYIPISATTMADDLALALDFNRRELRVAAVPKIYTVEDPASPSEQWERRVRIVCGLLSEAIPRVPQLLTSTVGRAYLVHKVYRVTVGVGAFWIAAFFAMFLFPPYGALLTVSVVSWAVLRYRGFISLKSPLDPLFDVIAMQAIPLAGMARLIRRRLRGGKVVGWVKVPR